MPIGILTAGGDCPGLNAAIRGVVARVIAEGESVVGVQDGWRGLMDGSVRDLTRDDVRGILSRGGTILGTSRIDPYVHGDGFKSIEQAIQEHDISSLIVIGGDGSLKTAARLEEEGIAIVGIPKTIDNDIMGTDVTLGFHTSVQIVVDAVDRLSTTAESHNRIMVVEVMGRTAGWIAAYAGMAGGAESILVPEVADDFAEIARRLKRRHECGHDYSVVIVAEGAASPSGVIISSGIDRFGFPRLGGVSTQVAEALESLTGYEARAMILGYLQRGGSPTAFDRVLGTRFGIHAAELAMKGESGVMVGVSGTDIEATDLAAACQTPRPLDPAFLADASWLWA